MSNREGNHGNNKVAELLESDCLWDLATGLCRKRNDVAIFIRGVVPRRRFQRPQHRYYSAHTTTVSIANGKYVCTQENQSILAPNIKGINSVRRTKNIEAYPFPSHSSLFNTAVRMNIPKVRRQKPMMPKSNAITKSTTKTLWRRDKTPSVRMVNANALENHKQERYPRKHQTKKFTPTKTPAISSFDVPKV